MDLGLKGRVAVITGASKGIGKGIARGLAAEGVKPVLLARGKDELEAAAAEIRRDCKVAVLAIPTDVTSAASMREAARQVGENKEFAKVNILVNNAGSAIRRIERQILWDDAEWLGDIEVKTMGAMRLVRDFLPLLAKDGTGRVVNITGVAGMTAWAPALTHGINNAALNHMVGYLAADLAPDKVTVNAVVPGLIATEWRKAWADGMAQKQGKTREQFLADYCKEKGILVGRWAEVEEVADMVVFLASDRGRYINGARIPIDGGVTVNPR
jgi:NAD(P)-dependent dehydrogenase (short-subunit alcohol dehydrogenase family)